MVNVDTSRRRRHGRGTGRGTAGVGVEVERARRAEHAQGGAASQRRAGAIPVSTAKCVVFVSVLSMKALAAVGCTPLLIPLVSNLRAVSQGIEV